MAIEKFSSYDAEARCDDCEFEAHSKNAHGLAAQHCQKYGHTVHIDVYRSYTLTQTDSSWHTSWKKMRAV